MNDKVTLQAISDIFASQFGLSKKTTEAFGKTFFATIVEGLNTDGVVKINGLGTFKIVEVGSRESIDVTNGERIVIDGYRKVSFTADELVEQKQAETIADVETVVAQAGEQAIEEDKKQVAVPTQLDEEEKDVAAEEVQNVVMNEEVESDKVEVPVDQFSGIDLLISTPESICEVEKDLSLARIRAEQTLEEAKIANVEYRRLEMLLERLKANAVPENVASEASKASLNAALAAVVSHDETPISVPLQEPEEPQNEPEESVQEDDNVQNQETETPTPVEEEVPASEPVEPVEQAEQPQQPSAAVSEEAEDTQRSVGVYEGDDDEEESSNIRLWILIPLVGVLLAVAGIFVYRFLNYEVPVEEPLYVNVEDTTSDASIDKVDSVQNASDKLAHTDSVKAREDKKAAEIVAAEEKAKAEKLAAEKKAAEEKAKAEKEAAEKKAAEEKAKAEKEAAEKKAAEEKAKKAKEDAAKANKPKVHTMMKGENLYQISKKYYGTYDSVRSIIRINKFPDPNNVPIGQVIKLP